MYALFDRPRLSSLLIGVTTCLLSPFALADTASERWYAGIAGGYEALADSSRNLEQAADRFCAAPSANPHERARLESAWADAFFDWQRVRFVDFGPVKQDSLSWQLQFWPDPKNLVGKKVRARFDGDQPISAESIAADSVAIKGFPAVEYLLFDEQFEQSPNALPASRSCALLTAITAHIRDNSDRLVADWARFRPHFVEQDRYADDTVRAAMHALELMKDRRLGAPMGAAGKGRRNPYLSDAWRSGQSMTALKTSLEGIRDMFLPGLALRLDSEQGQTLYQRFSRQLAAAIERLDSLSHDISPLLDDTAGYRQLQLLLLDIERLNTQLSGSIAPELGVVKGFNSSDGD